MKGLLTKCLFEEAHDFYRILPKLRQNQDLVGKYVLFYQGKVEAICTDSLEAYKLGISLLGEEEPWVIGEVSETVEEVWRDIA